MAHLTILGANAVPMNLLAGYVNKEDAAVGRRRSGEESFVSHYLLSKHLEKSRNRFVGSSFFDFGPMQLRMEDDQGGSTSAVRSNDKAPGRGGGLLDRGRAS